MKNTLVRITGYPLVPYNYRKLHAVSPQGLQTADRFTGVRIPSIQNENAINTFLHKSISRYEI